MKLNLNYKRLNNDPIVYWHRFRKRRRRTDNAKKNWKKERKEIARTPEQ